MTPGVDFHGLKIKNNIVNLQLWDLGGQDQFRYFQKDFFGGATLVILLYAVDSFKTFRSLDNWLGLLPDEMLKNVFLVGNKIDLSGRSVEIEIAMDYAEKHGMNYYEVSALTGVGVNEFEADLVNTIEKVYASRRKNKT